MTFTRYYRYNIMFMSNEYTHVFAYTYIQFISVESCSRKNYDLEYLHVHYCSFRVYLYLHFIQIY